MYVHLLLNSKLASSSIYSFLLFQVFEKVSVQIQATTEEEIERCHDLISNFVDSVYTLKYFVEIYPPASELLYKEGFPERFEFNQLVYQMNDQVDQDKY